MASTILMTIGYGGKRPSDFFLELDEMEPDMIVDVRENPNKAYLGSYTKAHFEKRLDHYIWIQELGNKTRQLPPTLVNEALGLEKLEKVCNECSRVVLLCAEKDAKHCHREYIKRKIETILTNQD